MLRPTVVVCVTPSPVPVIVIKRLPTAAFGLTLTVIVDVPAPGAAMELGAKVTVWTPPAPVADRVIAESKAREITVVMVAVPELPSATVIDAGDALMVKFGDA